LDFSYNEDEQALRALSRQILDDHVTQDRLKEVEASQDRIDRKAWSALAGANLLGVAIPEEHGGSDMGLAGLVILLEEIGRAVAPVPVYATLVLGALPIAEFGSEEQKRRLLPGVASGDRILTASLVETGDSDASARHDGTGWRLEGTRCFVPVARIAHRVLVPARRESGELGIYLVDPGTEGVSLEAQETTNRELQWVMHLSRVRVPEGDLLGAPDRGEEILGWTLDRALLAQCAMQLGVADRALRITADYTSQRRQFDRPVGSFQAVHTRAADAFIDVEAMRLTLLRALHLLTEGEPAAKSLAVAKYFAAEAGARVTYAAQHLHGGIGVDLDYALHRYYLWARQIGICLGSGSWQLAKLGEMLAARSLGSGS
jgi:alkylation response protein AidB-like acyl-CoA dehydrogenase